MGRRKVSIERKVGRGGLFNDQWRKLGEIAEKRGSIPTAYVLREAVDWYLTAIERSQSSANLTTKKEDEAFEDLIKAGK